MEKKINYSTRIQGLFERMRIFHARTGMGRKPEVFKARFKEGEPIFFDTRATLEAYSTIFGGNQFFSVGSFSSIGSSLPCYSVVGRYCSIAANAKITGYRHPIEAVSQSSAFFNFEREFMSSYRSDKKASGIYDTIPKPVPTPQARSSLYIGNDVWIGSNVTLAKGLTIGNGAVVAANSNVVKNVPAYAVVGGNPARIIKYRFSDDVINGLEVSKWWEYDLASMFSHGLSFEDPSRFLDYFFERKDLLEEANYPKITGLRFFLDTDVDFFETCFGTVLKFDGSVIFHDSNFSHISNLLSDLSIHFNESKIERNDDETVSFKVGDLYLSVLPAGTITFSKVKSKAERFFCHPRLCEPGI